VKRLLILLLTIGVGSFLVVTSSGGKGNPTRVQVDDTAPSTTPPSTTPPRTHPPPTTRTTVATIATTVATTAVPVETTHAVSTTVAPVRAAATLSPAVATAISGGLRVSNTLAKPVRVARTCVSDPGYCHPPTTPPPPPQGNAPSWARCPQWWGLAQAVGWSPNELPTMDRVMRCESGCNPWAHNRSGASGLMQIMPFWWHGRDPYNPGVNLVMALEIKRSSGWRAWSCF
jgi:transglycosylase-like protein with SLT domain